MTKKLSTLTLFTLIAGVMFITAISCKPGNENGEWIPTPPDTSALGKINHFIPRDEMDRFKEQFGPVRDSSMKAGLSIPYSEAFNKKWLLDVLKDPRCVGLRIYYGVATAKGKELRLMIVGVDEQGKDLYISEASSTLANQTGGREGGLEYGQCNPPCNDEP